MANGVVNYVQPNVSPLNHKNLHFLITDRPSDQTVTAFVALLKQHNVKVLVRVCEPTYNKTPVESQGIIVHDMPFPDGMGPPSDIIVRWLEICKQVFIDCPAAEGDAPANRIAIHCVAGLGRAPVLVAVALLEKGMKMEEAVTEIRRQRTGALNNKQLKFLEDYRPQRALKGSKKNCNVM